jgi:hypothetical protein
MRTRVAGRCPQHNTRTARITAHTTPQSWPANNNDNDQYNYYVEYGITLPVESTLIFAYQAHRYSKDNARLLRPRSPYSVDPTTIKKTDARDTRNALLYQPNGQLTRYQPMTSIFAHITPPDIDTLRQIVDIACTLPIEYTGLTLSAAISLWERVTILQRTHPINTYRDQLETDFAMRVAWHGLRPCAPSPPPPPPWPLRIMAARYDPWTQTYRW